MGSFRHGTASVASFGTPGVVSRAAVVGFVRFARLRILQNQSLLEKKRKAEMPKSAKEIIVLVARGVLRVTLDSGDSTTPLWVAGVGIPPPEPKHRPLARTSGGGAPTPATQCS